jgi:two-component system, sensor histidine kinase PdtaS
MSPATPITDCGVPGVKGIPYGAHLCHFYEGQQDLAETLVPYFAAGLRNNERCIWVTADPLRSAQAKAALRSAVPDADAFLAQDKLRILDFPDWYTTSAGKPKGSIVANAWLEEERAALADGHAGLRISGNTSFLADGDWDEFIEYEHILGEAFQGRKIVTLCSYAVERRDAVKTLDVVHSHHSTLHRTDASWQVLTMRGRRPPA